FDYVCLPIVNPRYKREKVQDWGSLIVGKTSPWLQLDSAVDHIRKNSEIAFKEELNYASHLGLPAQFWMHVPTMNSADCVEDILTEDLPPYSSLQRWLAEPVKAVIISTSLFLTNKKGYPVLSKTHQGYLRSLFKLDVQLILTGVDRHPEKGIHSYQQYLDHLWQVGNKAVALETKHEMYIDHLWQPLMDNLESQTYEIFEKDPIKYSQYQKAVYYALLDKIKPEDKETKSVVLMVVGAGRGPLVRASLAASRQADRKISKLYAVEKNPNAVVTLENLRDEMWGDQVEVISCDMRLWQAPVKADILVSELLGSFGDNELSPDIPCEYTSYLAPLQSSKLYNEVRTTKDKDKPLESNFEMPYVVRLHNCQILDNPKPVFQFHHPNRDEVIDNSRFLSLEFNIENTAILHGFAGYFDARLFGDVYLSIVPETHSPGMFSWFPILFPIKTPMYLKVGDKVEVDFWRRVSEKNVWYEWSVRKPYPMPIHNPKGRSYTIGL
ncbi:ANM5-like protein, partial [Mya arenaria]